MSSIRKLADAIVDVAADGAAIVNMDPAGEETVALSPKQKEQYKSRQHWATRPSAGPNRPAYKPHGRGILLIGQSQNGKSLLANYLVNGKSGRLDNFEVGDGGVSKTSLCRAVETNFTEKLKKRVRAKNSLDEEYVVDTDVFYMSTHVVIDTPGFGDTEDEDHAIQLHVAESIKAFTSTPGFSIGLVCIVVKYPKILDGPYIELLRMYRRLLGSHLENNLQVVFTDCSVSRLETASAMAEVTGGRKPEEVMRMSVAKIAEELGVSHDRVPVVHLEGFPAVRADCAHARSVRNFLLTKSLLSDDLEMTARLPKVPKWMAADDAEQRRVRAQMRGFLEGLTEISDNMGTLGTQLEEAQAAHGKIAAEKAALEEWLTEHDTKAAEEIIYNQDYVVINKKWMPWSRAVDVAQIATDFPVSSVVVTGVTPKKIEFKRGSRGVTITGVSRAWWKNGHYNVTVKTPYSEYYGARIAEQRVALARVGAQHDAQEATLTRIKNEIFASTESKGALERRYKTAEEELELLQRASLSFEEFRGRCTAEGVALRPLMPVHGIPHCDTDVVYSKAR